MSPFKPIESAGDLPADRSRREGYAIDAKAKWNPDAHPVELAKDVAAFANAVGGSIVIGAAEDPRTNVIVYVGVTDREAQQAITKYELAARDRCIPTPLFDKVVIPWGTDFLAVINVWAFPSQPVGVRVGLEVGANGRGGDAFIFPMRVGSHSSLLEPHQLAMLMLPEIRRVTLLLESLADQEFRLETSGPIRAGGTDHNWRRCTFKRVEIHPLRNTFTVCGFFGVPTSKVSIPLDFVETAYLCADGKWQVKVRGRVRFREDHGVFEP